MPTKPGPVLPVHHSVRVTQFQRGRHPPKPTTGSDVSTKPVTAWYRAGLLPASKSGDGKKSGILFEVGDIFDAVDRGVIPAAQEEGRRVAPAAGRGSATAGDGTREALAILAGVRVRWRTCSPGSQIAQRGRGGVQVFRALRHPRDNRIRSGIRRSHGKTLHRR